MNIVRSLFTIVISLMATWIGLFLVTFFHEMGHVIMYRILFRSKNWHITIGTGRLILKLEKFTIKALPIYGYASYKLKHMGTKLQYIMVSLGGPLVNALSVVLAIFLLQTIKTNDPTLGQQNLNSIIEFIFWANVYQFIFTIIPMKYPFGPYEGLTSDGMNILKKLKENSNVEN